MKMKPSDTPTPRAYRQTARADATAAREAQILASFRELVAARWLDEFTLQDVAESAGVTPQTVIRKFGGKEGLLGALVEHIGPVMIERRDVSPGAIDAALDVLIDSYEADGRLVMRLLTQEQRFPMLSRFLDIGRGEHRKWASGVFAPWLDRLGDAERNIGLDALVAACDLYLWQLLRRDLGYSRARTIAVMRRLVMGILDGIGPATHP